MRRDDAWSGTVTKKSRELLDGSNLYRQVTVRTDDGRVDKLRVDRALWKAIEVGDRLAKDAGQEPRRVAMRTIERTVSAPPESVWQLWTTREGISHWWAPDGFRAAVDTLDLRPGGELVYTMTAEAPEQVAFLEQNGLPLRTESRKVFTEIEQPTRICYRSVIDFVPGHAPYQQLTVVDLEPAGGGTRILMRVQEMHDDVWTDRLLAGRAAR